jgi:hypothetical protein
VTSGQTIPSAHRLPEDALFLAKPYTALALNEAIGAGAVGTGPMPMAAVGA